MQQRRALIVADAAGPEDQVRDVLHRFGFGPATQVATPAEALALLRSGHYDLLFVPLQQMDAAALATLDREVRRGAGTFVIGTAPQADPDLILRALRSGVHEFLVAPPAPAELTVAVDRLLRRTDAEVAAGIAVAVYSAKGGLGTTTVAVNLAHALARADPDRRVALADLVVSGGDVRVLLDLKAAYDVGDLLEKVGRIDADLLFSLLTPYPGGMWVLPSSEHVDVSDVVDGPAATGIIEQLKTHFGATVLDCEHHLSDRTLAAFGAAERIVLVTQLTVAALRSTQRTLAVCDRLGYGGEKLLVVANRFGAADVMSAADAEDVLGREIAWKLPNDYRTASAAVTRGRPVGEHDPASALAVSYAGLALKLAGGARTPVAGANDGKPAGSRLGRLLGFGRRR